jgi:Uma2 family endonuclease
MGEGMTSSDPANAGNPNGDARPLSRHEQPGPPEFDPATPRLGRRESEPHSAEVTYLFDVLRANFPADRPMWDLHHYFTLEVDGSPKECDVQFDISYFKDFDISNELPSYRASEHGNRVPTMAVNVLSKRTWRDDLSDNMETCQLLKIPLYVVFAPYHVATWQYEPPFLRAYYLDESGFYRPHDLKSIIGKEGETLKPESSEANVLNVSHLVPFRIGLIERVTKYKGGLPTYRMVLVHPSQPRIMETSMQIAVGKERERADQEHERAEQERERAEQERERAETEHERAEKEHERAERLQRDLANYEQKFGKLGE